METPFFIARMITAAKSCRRRRHPTTLVKCEASRPFEKKARADDGRGAEEEGGSA